jgi:hypothetical protein
MDQMRISHARCESAKAGENGSNASGTRKTVPLALRPDPLSDAERRCLMAVSHAGSVVLQNRHGEVAALGAGEWLPFSPSTFLRLVGKGLLEVVAPMRLAVAPGVLVEPPARPRQLVRAVERELEPA